MSPISPSDSNMAMLHLEQQNMIQKRLDMDALRERLNGQPDKKAKLREACEGFETVFIQKMWDQMRKNVQKSGYLHSRDEHMYQAMYDAEFSKKMTEAGGIGLADMLYEQLSQRLGESSRTTSTRNDPRLPIIPASSSASGIDSLIRPLNGEAEQAGISLNNKNIRPLYEDAPASMAVPAAERAPAADPAPEAAEAPAPESAAPLAAAPEAELAPYREDKELAPYDDGLDLEELSQSLLAGESSGPGEATVLSSGVSSPDVTSPDVASPDTASLAAALSEAASAGAVSEGATSPVTEEPALDPADAAMLEAALLQNMAEAGRITEAQAPVGASAPSAHLGTALATDTANPADSAAVSDMNNLPRS